MAECSSTPDFTGIPGLVLEDGEPVFHEPWEAQAFALCLSLHAKGLFTWSQWADALSKEIHGAEERSYYQHWLAALEKLLAQNGVVKPDALKAREAAWHEAAARTPHGEPIELKRSTSS
ncbi:MAG: nitrile hydratase accessory protein [Pseudomonadota bacterium]